MANFKLHELDCDVLVIGGGGAGLRAAVACRETGADVLVVSKTRVGFGNNTYLSKASWAAGGLGHLEDSHEVHVRDTLAAGCFLNDRRLVELMAQGAAGQLSFLERCGVRFAKKGDRLAFGYAPGHTYARHVRGENRRGSDLILPLRDYAGRMGVRFLERVFVTRLIRQGDRVVAATGISQDGGFFVIGFGCAVLATGGYAQIYLHTNNAPGIQGDGQAMAFEAGVPLKDMEFVQFYPTALGRYATRLLLYEALIIGTGAGLKNAAGEDVLAKHGLNDPAGLTRDRLSRAIMEEVRGGLGVEGGVILNLGGVSENKAAYLSSFLPAGWSPHVKELVVSPTAHFCMGGVVVNKDAQTALPGLLAAGEVCAGVHGANRLAGNALTEVFVMGEAAGKNAALRARETLRPRIPGEEIQRERAGLESLFSETGEDPKELRGRLRSIMWNEAGIIRNAEGLNRALALIGEVQGLSGKCRVENPLQLERVLELHRMLLVARIVCKAALLRAESRGAHFRSDFPEEKNPEWLKNIIIRQEGHGKINLETAPVPPWDTSA